MWQYPPHPEPYPDNMKTPHTAPLAVLTCTAKAWTPTLRRGDKWEILSVRETCVPGFISYSARRVRDGKRASFSRDSLRLSFRAARFLKSPAAKP